MRLEFKRTVEVKKYTCYMRLLVERERLDIQKYLSNFDSNTDDKVKKNVNKYLEKRGWIYQGQITSKGEEIITGGKIWDEEEGKYTIHCIMGDLLLNSTPLRLERVAPEKQERKNQLSEQNLESNLIKKEFSLNNDEYPRINIQEISINTPEANASANLLWKIEEDSVSIFEITGSYKLKNKIESINLNSLLKELFQLNNQYGSWDEVKQKLKVPFDKNKMGSMDSFCERELSLSTNQFSYGKFDSAKIYSISVMPKDKGNAEQWHNYLLEKELQLEYKNQQEAKDISQRISEKEEFIDFNLSPDTLKNSFLTCKDKKVFWHFFAPMDLDPRAKHQNNSLDSFSYSPQSLVSFKEIANRLKLDQLGQPTRITYYDLYVINEEQQKNFELLIKAILSITGQANIPVELITQFKRNNSKEERSEYLKTSLPWIQETDVNSISKNKLNHGRYLILQGNQKRIWEISISIDFISFTNQENIDIDTKGITRDVSFQLHKDDSILYPDLKTYIQSKGVI